MQHCQISGPELVFSQPETACSSRKVGLDDGGDVFHIVMRMRYAFETCCCWHTDMDIEDDDDVEAMEAEEAVMEEEEQLGNNLALVSVV